MKLITPRLVYATYVMTVCTGASMLAKSGLIDGYNAT
jgi:transcriptional regulator GlxA family with amidase domain